ncbi:predicted protein [Naegleria gruberi]|uniref:Predicted protein n=1 Tax=Naegleria gruberi TaxID=5762 RepID=D2VGQ7_NAEGR|nr:uncharacterized protein NAEGRDRAFT_79908 [Naegleria gruberi]EFC44104.1 predicted protein [Naegleria gruberi]|eukprot:XP_002676848.1 predicted protein [Naegleria gruberi strain NEG-M]
MAEDSDSNKEEYLEDEEEYSLKIADGDDGSDYDSSKEKRKRKKGSTRKKKTPKKKTKEKVVKVTVKLAEPSSSKDEPEDEQEMSDEEDIEEEKTQRKRRRSRKIVEIDPNIPAEDQLPVKFGTSQVVALGKIEFENENYHNDRYIFPIGYKAEKNYMSYKNPGDKTVYICEILDGGEEGPTFKITPADDDNSFTSSTPSGVWSLVIKKVNESRKKNSKTCTVSGPEYYGLSNARIRQLIEMLPNADKCVNYKKKFSNNDEVETTEATETVTPKRGRKKKEVKETETPKRKRSVKKEIVDDALEEELEEEPIKKKKKVKKEEIEEEIIDEEMEEKEPTVDFCDPIYFENDDRLSEPVYKMYREPLPTLREYQFTNYTENISAYGGHNEKIYLKFNMYTIEEVQEIYKEKQIKLPQKVELELAQPIDNERKERAKKAKEEKKIVEEYEKEEKRTSLEILRSMWELPYVFVGFQLLRPILKITEFDFDEFEDSLINPRECNGLLADIFIRLVKGPAIDRKTLVSLDPKCDKWKTVLKNKLDSLPPIYWLWKVNPLILYEYYDLTPAWRLIIIKALMEWKFETNQRVYDYSRSKYGITMLVDPIGSDQDGIKYWYYDSIGKLFAELPASLYSETKPRWEIKCSTKKEFEDFIEELKKISEELEENSEEAKSVPLLISSLEAIVNELPEPEPEQEPLSVEEKRKSREEHLTIVAKEREEEIEKQNESEVKEFKEPEPAETEQAEPAASSENNQTVSRSGRSIRKDFTSLVDEDELDESKRSLRPRKRKSYKEAEDEDKKADKDAEFVLDEDEDDDEDFYSEEEEEEEEEEEYEEKKSKASKKGNSKKVDFTQFKADPTKRNVQQNSFTNVSGVNFNPLNRSGNVMQQMQQNRNIMQQRVNKPQTVIMTGSTIQNNLRDAQSSNMLRNQMIQQQQQMSRNALQQQLAQNPALRNQVLLALQNNPSQQQQILQALQMRAVQQQQAQQQANMQQQNIAGVQNMSNISNVGNVQNLSSLTPGQLNVLAQMNEYRKQQLQSQQLQNPQQQLPQNPQGMTNLNKIILNKPPENTVNNAPTVINPTINQPTILNPPQMQIQSQNQSSLLLQLLQQNTAAQPQQPQQPQPQPQPQQFQTFNPLMQQTVAMQNPQQPIINQMGSSSQQQDQSEMDGLFLGEDSFV